MFSLFRCFHFFKGYQLAVKLWGMGIFLMACPWVSLSALTLSDDQPPVVVVAPEALSTERYAAKELAHYLGKILQIDVKIEEGRATKGVPIYVGFHPENLKWAPEKLGLEESLVVVAPDSIHVMGGRSKEKSFLHPELPRHDRGTLYAVYDLLERLGVRWYRPEPWGEHVPKQDMVVLQEGEKRQKPVFKYRYGINHYRTFTPMPSQIKDKAEGEAAQAERQMARTWAIRNRLNGNLWSEPEQGGYYTINFAHAYRNLIPPEQYFKTHPEYFALVNGHRSSDPNAQLCLSNPEVEELIFKKIVRQFEKNPELEIASLDPNDYAIWCECDACRAMDDPHLKAGHSSGSMGREIAGISMSNRVVTFNNRIAKRLREVLPDKKVGWYAYMMHTEVPTKVAHLESNTAVMPVAFAGSFSDYSKGLYDPKSKQNASFLKILQGYRKLTKESGASLFAHDYWSFYVWPGPLPVLASMHDKLKAYHRDFGVEGIYNETHPCWGPQGMILYFYTWLLRNPEGDLDSEKEYYYQSFYGPAAKVMREYHERLEQAAWGGPYFGSGGSEIDTLFTNQLLNTLKPLIREAEKLAAGDEILKKRVESVAAGWYYARKVRNFYDLVEQHAFDKAKEELDGLKAYFYRFADGSVFDNKSSVRGNWDKIFNRYRQFLEREGRVHTLFENPKVVRLLKTRWSFQPDPQHNGKENGWHREVGIDEDWPKLNAEQTWQSQGFSNYQGVAWYRKEVAIPQVKEGHRLILYFGAVDGDATVYINGAEIGRHTLDPETHAGYNEAFFFDITDIVKPDTSILLAVQVEKNQYVGGLTAQVQLLEVDSIRPPE